MWQQVQTSKQGPEPSSFSGFVVLDQREESSGGPRRASRALPWRPRNRKALSALWSSALRLWGAGGVFWTSPEEAFALLRPHRGEGRTRKVGAEGEVAGQVCEALPGVLAGAPRWPSGEGRGLRSEVGLDGLGRRRARLLEHILSLPLLICFSLLLLLL